MLAALLLFLLAAPVEAQTPSPLPEWEYSAGILLRDRFVKPLPEWETILGLAGSYQPRYDGSSHYEALPGIMLDVRYKDIAFLSAGEGLGVNFIHTPAARIGAALVYDLGRTLQDETSNVRRLGDVGAAPAVKVFAEALWFPVMFRVAARRAFGGYNGWAGDFGIYMPVWGGEKGAIFIGPGMAVGDSRYTQSFFGVTRAQSAASGLPVYEPQGGITAVGAGVNATRYLTPVWLVNLTAGADWLQGDAARSPTSENRFQYAIAVGIGYDFK